LIDTGCTVYILGYDINGSTVIGIIQRDKMGNEGVGPMEFGVEGFEARKSDVFSGKPSKDANSDVSEMYAIKS